MIEANRTGWSRTVGLMITMLFAGCGKRADSRPPSVLARLNAGAASVKAAVVAAPATAATSNLGEEQPDQDPTRAFSAPGASSRVVTGDWPMWGGTIERNMVCAATGIPHEFDLDNNSVINPKGKNVLWTARLGSQSYGNAVVANGKIFVGTNNGAEYRPKHKGDRGCLLAFDASGKFLWQLTREKLPQGRVNDWPEQGICSTCIVEGDRLWVVTNRAELMCLDTEGFYDGENDGPYANESDGEKQDADIVWSLDMIEDLAVFPHNLATSSPVVHEDLVFIVTSNGVDEAHLEVPSPRAPSFIAVNKKTGKVVWEDGSPSTDSGAPPPFNTILHGQWSSPSIGIVNGEAQVFMPGGDGWIYAFAAKTGKLIWKFDLNPKDSKYELGGRGTRNEIISTPVFIDNSIVLAVGQDPEHGEGVGHLFRIDATKTGDVSPEILTGAGKLTKNPNSAQIWHYGGADEKGELIYRRTISTVAVHNGLVFAADLSGYLHCLDFKTGKRYWMADMLAAVWGSPMVVDGKVYLGDEDGDMAVFAVDKQEKKLAEFNFGSSVYSTPTIAHGVMYVTSRNTLFAIAPKP
jgi:outer membrane protein assembly factor BamB